MELFVMRYVTAVAEYGNFSQAAEACHVGQPAMSQAISRLEKELGIPLFSRGARGAVPTEAGRAFVDHARRILEASDGLEAEMASFAGLQRGSLTLGLITSLECIEFGDMFAAFVRNYPKISFSIRQFGSYQLIDQLMDRVLDIAFINEPVRPLAAALQFTPLGTDRYTLAVPFDHPLAGQKKVSLRDLKEERFIFHQPWQVASELVLRACRDAGFEPNIACRSGMPSITLSMVRGGMGLAFLPSEEFENRNLKDISRVDVEEAIIKTVGVCRRKDANTPLIHTMADFAAEWCRYFLP